jgi:hypothetical protein
MAFLLKKHAQMGMKLDNSGYAAPRRCVPTDQSVQNDVPVMVTCGLPNHQGRPSATLSTGPNMQTSSMASSIEMGLASSVFAQQVTSHLESDRPHGVILGGLMVGSSKIFPNTARLRHKH